MGYGGNVAQRESEVLSGGWEECREGRGGVLAGQQREAPRCEEGGEAMQQAFHPPGKGERELRSLRCKTAA